MNIQDRLMKDCQLKAFEEACKYVCKRNTSCPIYLIQEDNPERAQFMKACGCSECDDPRNNQTPHCWQRYFTVLARKEAGKGIADE